MHALSKEFAVQLKHIPKETSWSIHGSITVKSGSTIVAHCQHFQHNQQLHKMAANVKAVVREVHRNRELIAGHSAVPQKLRLKGLLQRILSWLPGRPEPRAVETKSTAAAA